MTLKQSLFLQLLMQLKIHHLRNVSAWKRKIAGKRKIVGKRKILLIKREVGNEDCLHDIVAEDVDVVAREEDDGEIQLKEEDFTDMTAFSLLLKRIGDMVDRHIIAITKTTKRLMEPLQILLRMPILILIAILKLAQIDIITAIAPTAPLIIIIFILMKPQTMAC